jgi:citrate lyase beta subunit
VIDLEDALYNSSIEEAVKNIFELKLPNSSFLRIPYDPIELEQTHKYIKPLILAGFHNLILPKVIDKFGVESFIKTIQKWRSNRYQLILLIEHPIAIINLPKILEIEGITGIGLGSHDYCESVGMKHTLENLYWARMQLLNTGKAFNKEVIDIASMNLYDDHLFRSECEDAFSKGFDAKFIIHPWQLNIINNMRLYSPEEIKLALLLKDYISQIGGEKYFTIAKLEGKVIEKPHIGRIKKILKETGHGSF